VYVARPREFALIGEILRSFEWGALDLLMFDLPPGAEHGRGPRIAHEELW
jgi:Mrp family chromosome partitioning ATPase